MNPEDILKLFAKADQAVRQAFSQVTDWSRITDGTQAHDGQHYPDLIADKTVCEVLSADETNSCVAILSEESGWIFPNRGPKCMNGKLESLAPDEAFDLTKLADGEFLVAVDPLDGSSNAAQRIPWYALSLCALNNQGLLAAHVSNIAISDETPYTAISGKGAYYGSTAIQPSNISEISDAIVGVSYFPSQGIPDWIKPARQVRSMGAAALELCLVATGAFEIYLDGTDGMHCPWDYLAGMLICQEAGAICQDFQGRDMLELSLTTKRQPVAAASPKLLPKLLSAL